MHCYSTTADLDDAIIALIAVEPHFAAIHRAHGTPSLRKADPSFEGLLTIVTEQFLSLQAAASIWSRLHQHLQPLTPDVVLATPVDVLRSLGLSQAKVKSFHAIAKAACEGEIDFASLARMDDTQARQALKALPGIGPWSTEIFLLSNLARCDAWPAGDLALQAAAHDVFGLRARPAARDMDQLAIPWQPHRAAAARLLWAHYRSLKGLKQA
jgi:DNA-3-methyladenine glycosylase II